MWNWGGGGTARVDVRVKVEFGFKTSNTSSVNNSEKRSLNPILTKK